MAEASSIAFRVYKASWFKIWIWTFISLYYHDRLQFSVLAVSLVIGRSSCKMLAIFVLSTEHMVVSRTTKWHIHFTRYTALPWLWFQILNVHVDAYVQIAIP